MKKDIMNWAIMIGAAVAANRILVCSGCNLLPGFGLFACGMIAAYGISKLIK